MDVAIIGGEEFTLGFRLAGISRVINIIDEKSTTVKFRDLLSQKDVAIIMTDDATMSLLDDRARDEAESSVQPVVVTLSTQSSQEGLRKLILKSIGVDLWKN